MNINNLKKGMVFKNYKELCNFLGIPVQSSNSKKAQLKIISNCFDIIRKGNSFIIGDKKSSYNELSQSKGLYSGDIQILIMSILAENGSNVVDMSCTKLLTVLNLVNNNYIRGEKNINHLSEALNIPVANCLDFYSFSRNNLKRKIESALNALEKRKLIIWEKILYIGIQSLENPENYIHRSTTNEEKSIILKCEKKVLDKNEWSVVPFISPRLYAEYQREVKELLHIEFGREVKYYYKSYLINFLSSYIEKELSIIQERLNKNIVSSIKNEAKTRNNRANEKANELILYGDEKDIKFSKLHYDDEYVAYANLLTDMLIDINSQHI